MANRTPSADGPGMSTSAPITKERLRVLTACHSGTGAVPGKYTYRERGAVSCGRGVDMISTADRSSSGNAPFAPASANQSATSSLSLSGCSAARSCSSARSKSVWYSSQVSSLKWPQPAMHGWVVTAFQPSCQIAREPSIA